MQRFKVGVLGATGLVGQRIIQRLADHPWFEIRGLAASERSAGKPYAEATRWSLTEDPPSVVAAQPVRRCEPEDLSECDLVLSALDAGVAREVEPRFARAGFAVISNSSAYRQQEDVPLLVPEINASHIGLIERQLENTGGGYIVTNPNCSTTGLALALAPLHRAFGIRRLVVATLQAVSGAGMEGPRSMEMLDNALPYIAGEEEKMEEEVSKIFGEFVGGSVRRAEVTVSAHCHRVGVVDGHLEAVSLETVEPVTCEQAERAIAGFQGETAGDDLPSAKAPPLLVRHEPDRPQPRLDRDTGGGMTVVVGRIRPCPALGLKLELLSHNTVRGAAGGTVLNAELLAARGRLPRRGTA